jgi:hypothetical protein
VDTGICPHRAVSADGRIKCDKIVNGDGEVFPALCQQCPALESDCQHLCFALKKIVLTPITVRWATGHVEVWDDEPPRVSFVRSACSLKAAPVVSPAECLGCGLKLSWHMEVPLRNTLPEVSIPLADNVLPFPNPPHRQPGVPRALA